MAESDALVPPEWTELLRGGGAARVADSDIRDADLEEWATTCDRRLLFLDTQDCTTERELLVAFGAAFELDEDDECEWDTIDECLADFDISPASGLVIVWTGWDNIDDDPEHVIPVAVDALVTAARSWADEGRPWALLMAGDGESWELSWLGTGPVPWESLDDSDDEDLADDEDAWESEDEITDDSYTFDEDKVNQSDDQLSSW